MFSRVVNRSCNLIRFCPKNWFLQSHARRPWGIHELSSKIGDDDLMRDISSLDPKLLEEAHMNKDIIGPREGEVEESGDLMYQGEYHENWQELLEEARKAYPARGGKRRNNYKRRFRLKMLVINRQRRIEKQERIEKHFREMEKRKIRAQERKQFNWSGPRLKS